MEEVKFEPGWLDKQLKKAKVAFRFCPYWMRREMKGCEYEETPSFYLLRISSEDTPQQNYRDILKEEEYKNLRAKRILRNKAIEINIKTNNELSIESIERLTKQGYEVYRNLSALLS